MKRKKLTIFARIMIGYFVVFVPLAVISIYAFSQLVRFREITDDILQVDNRMRDLVQKIADSVLVQTRYERKYIITEDQELINQFRVAEADVHARIDEALSLANNTYKRDTIIRIKKACHQYKMTFDQEVQFVTQKIPYDQNAYKEYKEKIINDVLFDLKNFKLYIEQDIYEKIKRLGTSVVEANQMAISLAAVFIFLGIFTAFLITRSITKPLSIMRKNTRQIAGGNFDCSLEMSSPPEIGDLSQDFNMMCDKLKMMDKTKSDFFSLMAHELRTPLACIQEGTNLLLNHRGDDFKEQQNEILRIITEESNRLTDMVNALLDLSKMEAGMLNLKLEKSDIGYLINQAVMGMGPLALTKNIDIEVTISGELPYIKMDEERILQALRNLIGNAVKFTPPGGHITVSAIAAEKNVRVSVADTGPGILKEDLTAIFDKFQQGAMTNYSQIKGTGLGLAIVKHIINAHGGKIWVESEIGLGSIFIFLLPV